MAKPSDSYHTPHLMDYTYLPGYFTAAECQAILELPGPYEPAYIQTPDQRSEVNRYHRDTQVKTLLIESATAWLYNRVVETIDKVNQHYYHFDITGVAPLQILQYQQDGFFKEHYDIGQSVLSHRKLSMVVFLNPPSEYQGGQLLFFPDYPPLKQELGDVLLFPSYMYHEVKPVTTGVRYTLVIWSEGPCFQ